MGEDAELRCASRIHGRRVSAQPPIIEVKCNSRSCGSRQGVVVLHYFNLDTWTLQTTKRFQDPAVLFMTRERG